MPDPKSQRDLLAELMAGGQKAVVPHLAEMLKRSGIQEIEAPEERDRFWQAALTDEQEQQMWQQEMMARGLTQLIPGAFDTIDIGLKVSKAKYPGRWDMSTGEGRVHESDIAQWAYKQARKGPPVSAQQPSAPTETVEGEY